MLLGIMYTTRQKTNAENHASTTARPLNPIVPRVIINELRENRTQRLQKVYNSWDWPLPGLAVFLGSKSGKAVNNCLRLVNVE